MRACERRIHAVCCRLLDDARDVDEAVQDTFMQAWRNVERFGGDAAPSTWLHRIAVSEALLRCRRKALPTGALEEAGVPIGEDALAGADARAFLVERLRALPAGYRAAVVLRDVDGLTNEEVAAVMGISLAAAKGLVHRGRMRLRADLERWERAAREG